MSIVENIEKKRQIIETRVTSYIKSRLYLINDRIPDYVLTSPHMRVKVKFIRYVDGTLDIKLAVEEGTDFFELCTTHITYCSEKQQYTIMKEIANVLQEEGFKVLKFSEEQLQNKFYNYDVTAYIPQDSFNIYTLI